MAFDLPTDLIRQVQISLRNEAGLSSYDPDDPTLPPLPSLAESIAAFDPSPSELRCENCSGRFLRGSQSLICVYCGRFLNKEVPPEPIAFKSTTGYQWLLQSLELDGSEILGPSIEEFESKKGQGSPKDEKTLSDFLNLQIAWPAELVRTEISSATDILLWNNSILNFNGVDVENSFSDIRSHNVTKTSEDLSVRYKQTENLETNVSENQENLTLFQNVNLSGPLVRSPEEKNVDLSSGWEADFQSADSENQDSVKEIPVPSNTADVDLSIHMDSVFGPGKDLKDGKDRDNLASFSSTNNDWNEDDLWKSTNNVSFHQGEQLDGTAKAKDDITTDNFNSPSLTTADWFPDNHWHVSNTDIVGNATTEDEDSFDTWNDFTSSTGAQDTSKGSMNHSGNHISAAHEQTSEINLFSSTNNFDVWNDFTISTSARDSSTSFLNQDGNHKTAAEQNSDTDLFSSTKNFEDMDFGSFSQPDLFSQLSSNQDSSAEVNDTRLEVSTSERTADANTETGVSTVQAASTEDVKTSVQPKDKLESLLSEMHDLSFMLENNLSVPSKSGGVSSSSSE